MLFDPTRAWVHRATCRTMDFARFFPHSPGQPDRKPTAATQAAWDEMKAYCNRCPVLAECRRDTLGEEYGVFGGRDERERYLIRKALHKAAKKWPPARRLAWGKALGRLHHGGVSWTRIRAMTGMPDVLGKELIAEYEAHAKAEAARKAAVVLELPPMAAPRPQEFREFPDEPGQKHAWVKHVHLVADAYYAGQTEDGAWLRMLCWSGRGAVIKWFRPEDVRFYNDQPRFVVKYPGRAKRERRAREEAA